MQGINFAMHQIASGIAAFSSVLPIDLNQFNPMLSKLESLDTDEQPELEGDDLGEDEEDDFSETDE